MSCAKHHVFLPLRPEYIDLLTKMNPQPNSNDCGILCSLYSSNVFIVVAFHVWDHLISTTQRPSFYSGGHWGIDKYQGIVNILWFKGKIIQICCLELETRETEGVSGWIASAFPGTGQGSTWRSLSSDGCHSSAEWAQKEPWGEDWKTGKTLADDTGLVLSSGQAVPPLSWELEGLRYGVHRNR